VELSEREEREFSKCSFGRWENILYPRSLGFAYRLVLEGRKSIPEIVCDQLLREFLVKQDPGRYVEIFRGTVNKIIRRLILLRAAVACNSSFCGGNPLDVMPESMKDRLRELLGNDVDDWNNSFGSLEDLSRNACVEDLILGRIGYFILWGDVCSKHFVNLLPRLPSSAPRLESK
jgi:hypothetical protein